jgi:hypothetical protein
MSETPAAGLLPAGGRPSVGRQAKCGLAAALLAAGTALSAGDGDALTPQHRAGFYFALVPSVSTPDFVISAYDGDIRTSDIISAPGYEFGLFWEASFGWASSRLALGYGSFGGRTIEYWLYSKAYAGHQFDLTGDALLYLDESRRLYIFAGLGYCHRYIDESLWGEHMRSYDIVSGFCRSLGVGVYVSKRVGVELKRVAGDGPWTQLSLIFRS